MNGRPRGDVTLESLPTVAAPESEVGEPRTAPGPQVRRPARPRGGPLGWLRLPRGGAGDPRGGSGASGGSGDIGEQRRRSGRPRRRRRRVLIGLLAGGGLVLLVVVALAVDVAVRYLPASRALQHGRDEALAALHLLADDPTHVDQARLDQARGMLLDAQADFGDRSDVVTSGWLVGVARRLPLLGTQVEAADDLRLAGQAAVRLGLDLLPIAEEVVPKGTGPQGAGLMKRVTDLATMRTAELDRVTADLAVLEAAAARVPTGSLLGPLAGARDTLGREVPRVDGALTPALNLVRLLPTAVGPGTHRYLVLLNNPGEERPGGGFIGAVGAVTFTDGTLTESAFQDSYFADGIVKGIPAPRPLNAHLFHNQPWTLEDSNWSPDFPTSALEAERFYSLATHSSVDGVIGIDPVAIGYLLDILGPVQVAPYPQVVTAQNALLEINYISNRARPGDPGKVFLGPFGDAVVHRLLALSLGDMPRVSDALQRGAREKHIVMAFHAAQLQDTVDAANLAGRLTAPPSDALLVDDANLGGNKADLFVTRGADLHVAVSDSGQVTEELALTYTNPQVSGPDLALMPGSGGAYRDYLRVYLPQTAEVTAMTLAVGGGPPTGVGPEETSWENGREAVAYYLILPRGQTATLTLRYGGPFVDATASPLRYAMQWSKQVDGLARRFSITVDTPGGGHLHDEGDLVTDRTWAVSAPLGH